MKLKISFSVVDLSVVDSADETGSYCDGEISEKNFSAGIAGIAGLRPILAEKS